jgi:hypothetical protein
MRAGARDRRYARVDADGRSVEREVKTVHAHTGAAELGPYRHYPVARQLQVVVNYFTLCAVSHGARLPESG